MPLQRHARRVGECRYAHLTVFTSRWTSEGSIDRQDPAGLEEDSHAPETTAPAHGASSSGKYVPPSMRPGASRGAGDSMRGSTNRDDLPTLRVTNISEDTQENDLRELFGIFGRVARVYVGRDRETGAGKGFAFVSFEDRAAAQKAIDKVHGKGYDSLILGVQWSREFCLFWICIRCLSNRRHGNISRAEAGAEMIIPTHVIVLA